MPIDADKVADVAKLARIRVDDAELPRLAEDFNRILGFVEQLNEVDVEGVDPMVSLISVTSDIPKWRKDAVSDGGHPDRILATAPEAREGFFVVPKVVE